MKGKMIALVVLGVGLSSLAGAAPDAPEDRSNDREAIRQHIERIYRAFMHKDAAELRATHAEAWNGFLEGSRKMIRGIDQYMKAVDGYLRGPYRMTSFTIRDMDYVFSGDTAFVTFISENVVAGPQGVEHEVLRLGDFYVKEQGNWIQAGSNTSTHPESVDAGLAAPRELAEGEKKALLVAREAVWRAYFANDRPALERLIPEEAVTLDPGRAGFGTRQQVLDGAADFAKSGGRLVGIDFPATKIQVFGDTAILYSSYTYQLEQGKQRSSRSGRVTEVFVERSGGWVNPGWHIDAGND